MEHLKCTVETGDEREFTMRTTHFLRPALKQIKDSLHEIKDYYEIKDGVCFVPKKLVSSFKKLKVKLLERLKKDSFLFKTNIIRGYDIKHCEHGPVFVFMTESLGPVLDVSLKKRPDNIICDVFLAIPHQPLMVLTIVDGSMCEDAITYNTYLTSSITHRLHRFNDDGVHLIHGVLTRADIETDSMFKNKIEQCAKSSSFFFNLNSFSMDLAKYERILLSFWAAVAETSSVTPRQGEEEGSYVRFLTKEQCIVLVEMIDQKDVEVRCVPGTGSTTLMVEVARRLTKMGTTLLVCQTLEEEKEIRAVYQGDVVVKGSVPNNLSNFSNVIDATNAVKKAPGRLWRFMKDEESRPQKVHLIPHQHDHAHSGPDHKTRARKRGIGSPIKCGKCYKYDETTQGQTALIGLIDEDDNEMLGLSGHGEKGRKEQIKQTKDDDVKNKNLDLPKETGLPRRKSTRLISRRTLWSRKSRGRLLCPGPNLKFLWTS